MKPFIWLKPRSPLEPLVCSVLCKAVMVTCSRRARQAASSRCVSLSSILTMRHVARYYQGSQSSREVEGVTRHQQWDLPWMIGRPCRNRHLLIYSHLVCNYADSTLVTDGPVSLSSLPSRLPLRDKSSSFKFSSISARSSCFSNATRSYGLCRLKTESIYSISPVKYNTIQIICNVHNVCQLTKSEVRAVT